MDNTDTTAYQGMPPPAISVVPEPTVTPPEKKGGFFKNVGGIAKKVAAPLGVEVGSAKTYENKPSPSITVAPVDQENNAISSSNTFPEPAQEINVISLIPPEQPESPDQAVNYTKDSVFWANPQAYTTPDGRLDKEKLNLDLKRLKFVENNPNIVPDLISEGISVPQPKRD